jgi:hypothetical protein
MRRLVAVLGAVFMVGAALLVRDFVAGDDEGGGDSSETDDRPADLTLVCAEELEAVCEALEDDDAIAGFATEDAGVTVDRVATEDLEADAWLTLDPFPGMADVAREQAGEGTQYDEPMGTEVSTDMAIVAHPSRADALAEACGGEVDWECLGEVADDPWSEHGGDAAWGQINIGMENLDSASGLLTSAQAVGDYVENDQFASNDLDANDVDRWMNQFSRGDGALDDMVLQGAGAYSAVGALGTEAEAAGASAQGQGLVISYPAPMYRAEVVLVAPGASAEDLIDPDVLASALADAGWEGGGATTLPSAGAMYALREELR